MMSEQVMKQFRVQVTKTMNTVLKNAIFEVMTIFENALLDHRKEMAQKGEEVCLLKVKLQAAELRLKNLEPSDPRVETSQTPTEVKDFLDASKPTTEVAEIDVDVPDDWCAPLGCEVVTKEEDDICPSVRLRQFSIPLWQIPIQNQRVSPTDPMYSSDSQRPQRTSALNAKHKLIGVAKRSVSRLGNQSILVKNYMKRLPEDRRGAYSDLKGFSDIKTKEKRKTCTQDEQSKSTAVQDIPDKVGNNKNKYPCGFCSKLFDTEFGLKRHVYDHKKCRGCNKVFRFPSGLKNHKKSCPKFKKMLLKEASNSPKASSDEETGPVPSTTRSKLAKHMQIQNREHWLSCTICQRKFASAQAVRVHVARKHKIRDFEWTKPLEDNDDGEQHENSASSMKDTGKVRNWKTDFKNWPTMGIPCPQGFACILCEKILSSKYILTEHFRIHTGEKPLGCKICPATFRYKTDLSKHIKTKHLLKDSQPV